MTINLAVQCKDNNEIIFGQVLSLGSGFDSAYFRLKYAGKLDNCCYVEVGLVF